MRIFYSKHAELAEDASLIIYVNGAEVGDVTASELWINAVSGSYSVSVIARDGQEEVELTKGVDVTSYGIEDTGAESRMMYLTSDAAVIKVTAVGGDAELDVKVIY